MISKQTKRDILTYTVLWISSILVYFIIIPQQIVLKKSWSGDVGFSSQTFPKLLSVCLFIVSIIGMIETWCKINKEKATLNEDSQQNEIVKESKYVRWMPCIVLVLCIIYRILFAEIGFIIASAIMIPVMLLLFHCRKWQYYLSSYIFMITLYVVFKLVMRVPLP